MSNETFARLKKDELEMAAEIGVIDDILDQLNLKVEKVHEAYSFILSQDVVLECTSDFACITFEKSTLRLNKVAQKKIYDYCLEN